MNASKIVEIIGGAFMLLCIAFVVVLLLLKTLWAWTVPDLFPGAVERGLVAGSISRATAAKVAVLLAVLSAFARAKVTHHKKAAPAS